MSPTEVGGYNEAEASAILAPISVSRHHPSSRVTMLTNSILCLDVNTLLYSSIHSFRESLSSWHRRVLMARGGFNMMILQYFLYQRGDKAWIKLLVGYLCVSPQSPSVIALIV